MNFPLSCSVFLRFFFPSFPPLVLQLNLQLTLQLNLQLTPIPFPSVNAPTPTSFVDRKISASVSLQPLSVTLYKDPADPSSPSFTLCFGVNASLDAKSPSADFSCDLHSLRLVRGPSIPEKSTVFSDLLVQSSLAVHCSFPNGFKDVSCSVTASSLNFILDSLSVLQVIDIAKSIAALVPSQPTSTPTPPSEPQTESVSHSPVVSVTCSFPLLRVLLVSSSYRSIVPIAFAEFRDLLTAVELQESFTSITVVTHLGAKYFKTEFGQWETCIETWPLSVRYLVDYEDPLREPSAELEVKAESLLNVNLTCSFLNRLVAYLEELDHFFILDDSVSNLHLESPRQSEVAQSPLSSPDSINDNFICFVNHSGRPIRVDITGTKCASVSFAEASYVLPDGVAFYSTLLAFPSFQELLQDEIVVNDYKEATVSLEGYRSNSLPLYSESTVILQPATNRVMTQAERDAVVVVRNHTQYGRKEIVLSGRVSIVNNSGLPLFYAFSQEDSSLLGIATPLDSIPNHCEVFAPASCCHDGVLVLSMETQCSKFEGYTVAHIPVKSFDDAATSEQCIQVGRKQCCIRLFATRKSVLLPNHEETSLVTVVILPCLVIHNLLPVTIRFAISDDKNTRSRSVGAT